MPMTSLDPQPLHGVRVLELGSFIAGPFAGQLLADYGAEVLKIEPPNIGDPMRRWGVCIDGRSLWWPSIARGKKSLAIDLRLPEGQALVLRLAKECDVVLENFAPGRLEAWGLGYEELSSVNPGLILVRVSGFGQTGPRSLEPGFGSVGEAMGGLRYTTGFADRPPARTGISLGDSLAATFAVIGTLLALYERKEGGKGQVVDVALYESVFAFMESLVADYEVGGVVRGRSGTVLSAVAPSNIYNTLDDVPILIAANADSVFRRLADATGVIDPDDARFATHEARSEHMETLDSLVSQWVGSQRFDQISATLAANRVPFSTINSAEEILADQQFAAREMIQRFQAGFAKPVPMAGVVPRLSRTPGRIDHAGPLLGEHTTAVLQGLLKLTEADLEGLVAKGVIA
jgi:crotonobetainyl-CoA:carnitine CoA-transferase CaiB-like acyl-CoA transferase